MILRNLIVVFMALAIANPACCCAFSSAHKSSQTTKSCCSGNSRKDNDNKGKTCTCSIAKEKAAPEVDLFKTDPGSSNIVPLPTPDPINNFVSHLPEAVSYLAKWPPGRLPVPHVGVRLATKCSYLI